MKRTRPKFYAKEELDDLYKELWSTPFKQKSKWQQFINNDESRLIKQRRKHRNHEILSSDFIDMDLLDNKKRI